MNTVAALPAEEREALFSKTAEEKGIASSVIPEKDFWVCFTLHHLFSLGFRPQFLFKGGTSLSKAFQLIERFSEDVDLTLNRSELGFGGANDPLGAESRTARGRQLEELAAACSRVVRDELEPALRASFSRAIGAEGWSLESVATNDGLVDLHFQYPQGLASEEYGGGYVAPLVRLEIGARGDQEPSERALITSYAAEHFPQMFEQRETEVLVLSPERTFWEKVTIFHAEFHRPPAKNGEVPQAWKQLSRHAYDIVMMTRGGIADKALARRDLLEQVARHKDAFFYRGWARYNEAVPGTLRLVPHEGLMNELRRDYDEMRPMFLEEPPGFDELIEELRQLEARINGM
jgi:hypothetical protein